MNRAALINRVEQKVITDAREDSFDEIAALWSVYLHHPVTGEDAAMMMILLKVAWISLGFSVGDSLVDIAGYAACAAEYIDEPTSDPLSGAIAAYDLRNGIQPV